MHPSENTNIILEDIFEFYEKNYLNEKTKKRCNFHVRLIKNLHFINNICKGFKNILNHNIKSPHPSLYTLVKILWEQILYTKKNFKEFCKFGVSNT